MSKILIIGVGGAGRNAVQRMKEVGIPDANYITFGGFREDYVNGEFKRALPNSDIPHFNLIKMNGLSSISAGSGPKVYAELAENVKDQIEEIITDSFKKDANGLISKDAVAHINGLFLIECSGDNHTFCELYKYRKGERIWKYFEGEYEHYNGKSIVKPINIKIDLETDATWEQGITAPVYGLYIVAYTFQDNSDDFYGYCSSYGATESEMNTQCDKKNYALIYAAQDDNLLDVLTKSRVPNSSNKEINWEDARVLSYYIVRDDSELMKIENDIQELENEEEGLFSRIIHFFIG